MKRETDEHPHSPHWGALLARVDGGKLRARPHPDDPDPSPLLSNIEDAADTEGLDDDRPKDAAWAASITEVPTAAIVGTWLRGFREDPEAHPLSTPSGRIEIFSETIASFGYADCPDHPAWLPADEWLGGERAATYPLQLIANQPAGRLHSQLAFGTASRAQKVGGREIVRLNPADAAARGIASGDVVRLFNDRGARYASAAQDDALPPSCVQLSTSAWSDPLDAAGSPTCLAGNPNSLTHDRGTSSLAQGCTGQLTLVDVERAIEAPKPRGHGAPAMAPWPASAIGGT